MSKRHGVSSSVVSGPKPAQRESTQTFRKSATGSVSGRMKECHEYAERRCGMSLDDLAFIAARRARGESFRHPLRNDANGLVCESIRRMVYGLAMEYVKSCNESVDDLAQDCLKRISQRIGGFDPGKAKFTTWSWRVCQSVLGGVWRREKSRNSHIASIDVSDLRGASEPSVAFDDAALLRTEILDAIQFLKDKYPKQRTLVSEIFGDFVTRRVFASKLAVSRAAKKAGMTYDQARVFVDGVVRPHFQSRFAEAM